MSKGPVVTGIGNAEAVSAARRADRDAVKRWRCDCGLVASGTHCRKGHAAPWVTAKGCLDCGKAIGVRAKRCRQHAHDTRQARWREWYANRTPEQIAHRRAVQRAWRERNLLRVAASKRKGRLSGTQGYVSRDKYLAAQAKQNARRKERKRELMRERYRSRAASWSKVHTCRQCDAVIPFNHVGRPRLDCFDCRPARAA